MAEKVQRRVLSNGLSVVFEKRALPVVAASITNKFGAAYETSEIKGVAHVIEHLLFTGTKTRSHEDISREIEKRGGLLNAFTSHEVTSYWFKLPSAHLFAGLDILVDMIKNPKFDVEKFEKEKKVILEEIKMYHDNPRLAVFEHLEKNMFEKPFGELVIGNTESVSSLNRDEVVKLFNEHYDPARFFVTIVGDADFEKVCKYFEEQFEAKNLTLVMPKIVKKNGDSVEERAGIDQAHLVIGMHAPLMNNPEVYPLLLLDAYLANGMSSKLFLEIREKKGLAYAVKSGLEAEENYAYYTIYVGTTKEAVDEVKKLIREGFEGLKDMKESELAEAKDRVVGLHNVSSEESTDVMRELINYELNDDLKGYSDFEKRVRAVKLEDVKKLAESLLKKGFSSAAIVPK